jgi:hypothetical protein
MVREALQEEKAKNEKIQQELRNEFQNKLEQQEKTINVLMQKFDIMQNPMPYKQAAHATIRKVAHFGYIDGGSYKFDFEWPKVEDLHLDTNGAPLKVIAIDYAKSTGNSSYIGAIQLTLSNGQKSPVFLAKDQQAGVMETRDVNFDIKKIRGTYHSNHLSQVHFHNADDTKVVKVETMEYTFGPDQQLNPGEYIVGIYGGKNREYIFNSIGFLVWKQPV